MRGLVTETRYSVFSVERRETAEGTKHTVALSREVLIDNGEWKADGSAVFTVAEEEAKWFSGRIGERVSLLVRDADGYNGPRL